MKRIWILILIPILSGVAAFILTIDYKQEYISKAQLATGFTIEEEVKIIEGRFNLREADIKFSNLIETLKSPIVISLLSYKLLLHDLLNDSDPFRNPFNNEDNKAIQEKVDLTTARSFIKQKLDSLEILSSFNSKEKDLIKIQSIYKYDYKSLLKNLIVKRVDRTDYLSVEYSSENPILSAFVVNELCNEYLRYSNSMKSKRTIESVQTFYSLVEQKRKELETKSELLKRFKATQGVINLEAESTSKISQISDFEAELEAERKELRSLRLSLNEVNRIISRKSDSKNGILKNNSEEILKLKEEINTLNQRYIKSGSKDEVLASQLIELRKNLTAKINNLNYDDSDVELYSLKELQAKKRDLEVDLNIANQNIVSLENTLIRLKNNVGLYASKEAEISKLEREVQLASEEYLNAQEKYNSILDLSSTSSRNNIRQVLVGQPPVEPESSKRVIITAIAILSSFIFCVIVIVFLEYIDLSIKSPSYFEKTVGLKLISVINQKSFKKADFNLGLSDSNSEKKFNTFRELIKKLRFEIEASKKQVFLVSSTKPGEGKSTIIRALTYSLSLSKKSSLIIDTNFSNNTLTKVFNANPQLEDISRKRKINGTECNFLKTIINHTTILGVDIIGSKGGKYSPSELFYHDQFISQLKILRDSYDYIFLEGAALNDYSDARELEPFVDGVISIFSAKSIIKQMDKEGISFLKSLNGKFVGAVLNKVEIENLNQ